MINIKNYMVAFTVTVCILAAGCCSKDLKGVEKKYGEGNKMSKKVLVTYGTRAGSTTEIAESIGKTLAENGLMADVIPVKSINTISGYDAVIIGSSIRTGGVLPEVMDFIKSKKKELIKVPVAVFIVCMTLKDDTSENRNIVNAYIDPVRAEVTPFDTALFAGKMDYSKLGFFARFASEKMIKVPEGDFRNWKAIEKWGTDIAFKIKQ